MWPTDHGLLIPDQGNTMEYYSAPKKNEIMPFETTWMNLEMVMLNELSQTEEKYHMIYSICGLYKEMMQMNLLTKQNETDRLVPRGKLWSLGWSCAHCYI